MRTRAQRWRWLLISAGSIVAVGGCRAARPLQAAFGANTAAKPHDCLVIGPQGMPPVELEHAVSGEINAVAAAQGQIVGFVAVGPSAAAFSRITFDAKAHGGVFTSDARNGRTRASQAQRWGAEAGVQVNAQLAVAEPVSNGGLDLLGGIGQCASELAGVDNAVVVVVSNGLHRTIDLDLAEHPERAVELSSKIDELVPPPTRLKLVGVGRVDPAASDGPIARAVIEPLRDAWTTACAQLGDRCVH